MPNDLNKAILTDGVLRSEDGVSVVKIVKQLRIKNRGTWNTQ